jgi:hypothetical protein
MRAISASLMTSAPEVARGLAERAGIREYVGRERGGVAGRVGRVGEVLGVRGLSRREIQGALKGGPEELMRLFGERGDMSAEEMKELQGILTKVTTGGKDAMDQVDKEIQGLRTRMGVRRREQEEKAKEEDYAKMGTAIAGAIMKQWKQDGMPVKVIED